MNTDLDDILEKVKVARRNNDRELAHNLLQQAQQYISIENSLDKAKILCFQAQLERDDDLLIEALGKYNEALNLYQLAENALSEAHVLRHIADIQQLLDDTDLANHNYQKALLIYQADRKNNLLNIANTLRGLAILKEHLIKHEEARHYWSEALKLYKKTDIRAGVSECKSRLAALH